MEEETTEETAFSRLIQATELLIKNKITIDEHEKFLQEVKAENLLLAQQLKKMEESK